MLFSEQFDSHGRQNDTAIWSGLKRADRVIAGGMAKNGELVSILYRDYMFEFCISV